MNRTKKVFLLLLITMITCFSMLFAGCGTSVEGTYKFKKMSYQEGGVTVELEAGEEFMGMFTLSADFMSITLNKDGSAVMSANWGSEETSTGKWEKGGNNKITLEFDGEDLTASCDGTTMEFEIDGVKLTLKK